MRYVKCNNLLRKREVTIRMSMLLSISVYAFFRIKRVQHAIKQCDTVNNIRLGKDKYSNTV